MLQCWDCFACRRHVCFPFARDGDFGTSRLKGSCGHNTRLASETKGDVTARHGSWPRRDELNGVGCEVVRETQRLFREDSGFQLLDRRGVFVELYLDDLVEAAIDGGKTFGADRALPTLTHRTRMALLITIDARVSIAVRKVSDRWLRSKQAVPVLIIARGFAARRSTLSRERFSPVAHLGIHPRPPWRQLSGVVRAWCLPMVETVISSLKKRHSGCVPWCPVC
jgi:hypothetical protein